MAKTVEQTEVVEGKGTETGVVLKEGTAIAVSEVITDTDGMALDFIDAADLGTGFEGTDADSFAIPFLMILQKMSPLVDEDSATYVEGAKAGMLYDTVTGKLYDGKKGVLIIPCAYKRNYLLWGGQKSDDKGFKGSFTVEEFEALCKDETKVKVVDGRNYVPSAEGTVDKEKSSIYQDTRQHFVLIYDADTGTTSPAILSLASTQIKASKNLMTALQQKKVRTPRGLQTPPAFANVVLLTTQSRSNDSGSWSVAKFDLQGLVKDADVYQTARSFHNDITAGSIVVDYNKADETSTSGATDQPKDAEEF